MPLLRLAYVTQFMIAVIAVFALWSQVGGQSHLDITCAGEQGCAVDTMVI